MIMKNKYWLLLSFGILLASCKRTHQNNSKNDKVDSVELAVELIVKSIINESDSLTVIPSLKFAKGDVETYAVKMYGENQVTKRVREEHISNEFILGRDYFYNENSLIFIKEEGSIFTDDKEIYTEKLIYFNENKIYNVYEKQNYTEDDMFEDSLFQLVELDLNSFDIEKPERALNQEGEFTMYFDEFLFIEPQTYLIVENADQTMNAALYIIEGDSLLDELYANPTLYEKQKLWVYHSFLEMSGGIERMIYEGAVLTPK